MYVLYAEDNAALKEKARLFNQYMEPLLQKLEAFAQTGRMPADIPEFRDYLSACRYPVRQLEYSLALEALLKHLKPGDHYLDADCDVTLLAYAVAGWRVRAEACDGDRREIETLRRLTPESIYGSYVSYSAQDLTRLEFADESFDAGTCISVLEHIPAPHDQQALRELLRVLKPGGLLVLTVDFIPADAAGMSHYAQRVAGLLRQGNFAEIARGVGRRLNARQVVAEGGAQQARTANQFFQISHLEQDILPVLMGEVVPTQPGFSEDLRAFTREHMHRLWRLEPAPAAEQADRPILPAACVLRKTPAPIAA